MAQQTAVEWFIDSITESGHLWMTDKPNDMLELAKFIEQAKQMEKDQIIYAHLTGLIHPLETEATKQAEQYYNETFRK